MPSTNTNNAAKRGCPTFAPIIKPLCKALSICALGLGSVLTITPTALVQAQEQTAREQQTYAIPAGPLAQSLNRFASEAGITLSFTPDLVEGQQAPALSGQHSVDKGLRALLAGSGLVVVRQKEGGYRVTNLRSSRDGVQQMSPIQIAGSSLPQDLARTEGTGSYVGLASTVGSKTVSTLRQTPQSVSVITQEQIQDQNATTLREALDYSVGTYVSQSDTAGHRFSVQSRGYSMGSYQIDGMRIDAQSGRASPTFDLAIYDRIEVLRGPAGLFLGSGDPAGVINLVHKRPTAVPQFSSEVAVGSWSAYGFMADASGALNDAGSVRGRVVGLYDSQQTHIDVVETDVSLLYATVEGDLTEKTTLTTGGTYERTDSVKSRGLPMFADGTLLDVPRSRFAGFDWNNQDFDTAEAFVKLTHQFDADTIFNASGRYYYRDSVIDQSYSNTAVDPETGEYELRTDQRDQTHDQFNLDTNFSFPLRTGDLTHRFLIGADYTESVLETVGYPRTFPMSNIYSTDYSTVPLPDAPADDIGEDTIEEYGIYGQTRLKVFSDATTLLIGGRLSWWNSRGYDLLADEISSEEEESSVFTPYVALVRDINEQLSAYASYTEIFSPQTAQMLDGGVVPPRVGSQYEVGLKTEMYDGTLLGSLAAFRIRDKNRAIEDPRDPDYSIPGGLQQSRGIEAELTGKVRANWDVIVGYAYTDTEILDDSDPRVIGESFNNDLPDHRFTLWTKYAFEGDTLDRLSIGGVVQASSSFSAEGDGLTWTQNAYQVVDARVAYQITPDVSLSLFAENLLDEVYFSKLGDTRHSYYGTPRNFELSLRATF